MRVPSESAGRCLGLALSLALLVMRTTAHADVAVAVPPQLERDAGPELGEQAVDELTRLLKVGGFNVISPGQAAATAEAEQQRGAFSREFDPLECFTPACAHEYRRLFDATFAVQMMLLGKGVRASSLTLVITEKPDVFFAATSPVEGRDVRSAVRSAFERARAKQLDGAGPWFSASGSPSGALVYVDGMEFGRIPFAKRHLKPGPHRLEVRAPGHVTLMREVHVPDDIDHTEFAQFVLPQAGERSAETRSSARRDGLRRNVWDYALGGALVAAGAAHLVAGSYQKSKSGDCAKSDLGRCVERYGSERGVARENVLIGVGAAGVVLGALAITIAPLGRFSARAGRDHAQLHFAREF